MLKGDLSYCAEIKCGMYRQTWVKINAPDGYKGQGVRKGINQQTKITRNNLSHILTLSKKKLIC